MLCWFVGRYPFYRGFLFFFFFQAEDGIRDVAVTGVQTCALPISRRHGVASDACAGLRSCIRGHPVTSRTARNRRACRSMWIPDTSRAPRRPGLDRRSEERRVGKEGRSRWSPDHLKKKKKDSDMLR